MKKHQSPLEGGDNAERFAKRLGIEFHDLGLLQLALMHRSTVQDRANANPERELTDEERASNERLEFLGDSVLGYVVAEYLYKSMPHASEGAMTAQRAELVRAEQLVRWARELELADYLYLGQGERVTEGARDRMLAGAFEAIVAAIALDRGLREARKFLRRYLDRDAAHALTDDEVANAKGKLQELAQEKFRLAPVYGLISAEGPDHARTFTIEVSIDEQRRGLGVGASKRIAEQAAAREALGALIEPTPASPADAAKPLPRKRRHKSSPKDSSEQETAHVPIL